MVRLILFFIVLFFSCAAAQEPISAGIKYNEATAKIEAFKDVNKKLEKDIYKDFFKDKNKKENLKLIADEQYLTTDRELSPFYLKNVLVAYCVTYYDKLFYNFYYNYLGQLIKIETVEKDGFPKRKLGYSRFGNLISVTFEVDESEQFVYDEKGNLLVHWKDNELKNKNNKIPKILNIERK